jgi:phage baseplate assembly protein W
MTDAGEDILFSDDYEVVTGDLAMVTEEAALRQSIHRLLVVSPGEWKTRPMYGVGLKDYLKKPITAGRKVELQNRIVESLRKHPRVERLDGVTVEEVRLGTRTGLKVTVRVQAAGTVRTLRPFTFYREV